MNLLTVFMLAGAVAVERISLDGLSAQDPIESTIIAGGDLPVAGFRFLTSGDIEYAEGDTGSLLNWLSAGEWLQNSTNNTAFELRITQTGSSGDAATLASPTLGVWAPLSSGYTVTLEKDTNAAGVAGRELTVEIREILETSNIVTLTGVTLTVETTL